MLYILRIIFCILYFAYYILRIIFYVLYFAYYILRIDLTRAGRDLHKIDTHAYIGCLSNMLNLTRNGNNIRSRVGVGFEHVQL
jgi:hypothetical protein